MPYSPAENRYDSMVYNRCGNSGLKLPATLIVRESTRTA